MKKKNFQRLLETLKIRDGDSFGKISTINRMSKTRKRRGGGWFSINPTAYTSPQNRLKAKKDATTAMNLLRKYSEYHPEDVKNDAKETMVASSKYQFLRKKAAEIREELRNIEKEKDHIYNLEILKITEKILTTTERERGEDFEMARY